LVLLIGPLALLILNALLQLIVRYVFSTVEGGSGGGPVVTVINVISLLIGIVATLALVPGLIVGVIFLATPEKDKTSQPPHA
jgi:hypothetical protein